MKARLYKYMYIIAIAAASVCLGCLVALKIRTTTTTTHTDAWERKSDLAVKRSKVFLGSSFEQTCQGFSARYYKPSFSPKAFLILEKKSFKCFESLKITRFYLCTVGLRWLEPHWDHKNLFETAVVRASEGYY